MRPAAIEAVVSKSSLYGTARKLESHGLLVRYGPSAHRLLALNPGHLAYAQLCALLDDLARIHPPPRGPTQFTGEDPIPKWRDRWQRKFDLMFGLEVRSRVLCALRALGNRASQTDVARVLPFRQWSVRYALNSWERDGITISRYEGSERLYGFNLSLPYASRLLDLIDVVLEARPEYLVAASYLD
jgi:hypothetical protein